MKNLPLVSIITPCYNGAKVITRMMESVIAQTYGNIEYILVNDGSTDETEEVVLPLGEKMKAKGYRFVYVKQENGGLGAAINAGLRVFTGDYLCWADADDFYAPESVEKRVVWMENNPEYGVITSDAVIVPEDDVTRKIRRVSEGVPNCSDENQFWHLLRGESIFTPGTHMARAEMFLKCYPERQIYPARRGQDWQLLLPMYYNYKRHYMDEPLFYYVVSSNSMSRDGSSEKKLFRCDEHEDIIAHTLAVIDMKQEDRNAAERLVKTTYASKRLSIAYHYDLPEVADTQKNVLRELKAFTGRRKMYYFGAKHRWAKKLLKKLS